MKHKKTIVIFDDKSEVLALSRMRRKPETVFLIVPFEYLGGTSKAFRLIADTLGGSATDADAMGRATPETQEHIA